MLALETDSPSYRSESDPQRKLFRSTPLGQITAAVSAVATMSALRLRALGPLQTYLFEDAQACSQRTHSPSRGGGEPALSSSPLYATTDTREDSRGGFAAAVGSTGRAGRKVARACHRGTACPRRDTTHRAKVASSGGKADPPVRAIGTWNSAIRSLRKMMP